MTLTVTATSGVQRDLDLMHADRLDWAVEHDLALGHLGALALQRLDDVAGRDRAVELAGVRRLADQLDGLAVDALRGLLGIDTLLGILGLDAGAIGLEQLLVALVGAQRLLVRKQVIARETVLDGDDVANGAQFLDAFKQDDFHGLALLTSRHRGAGRGGGRA